MPENKSQTNRDTTSKPAANDSVTMVDCPTCKQAVAWTAESQYRPFCSERCKLIDLGEWASEGHKIPGSSMENDVMSGDLDY